jgi:exopolyphosphatase/guanosine-5'-triphosphate,3'-diphosphate pyrophosphatase
MLEPSGKSAPGRLPGNPVAVVDIGSNSVRLVVYERLCRAPTPLFNEKELCGLGRGISSSGKLEQRGIDEALSAIRRFRALTDRMKVEKIHVLATSAPRDAKNGPEFIDAVENILGVHVAVLSGREEARLSALGVVSGIRNPDGVAGDLGGGSLELIDVRGKRIGGGETFPLGGIRLEEAAGKAIKQAEKIISGNLEKSSVLPAGRKRAFYAIGGTWRSLARLHMRQKAYPLHVMHHYAISPNEAYEFCKMVAKRDVDSLDSIEAVSRSRRPLLPYGAAVLAEVIKLMEPSEIVLSALGVREGLLYDLLEPSEQERDPLISAAEELAVLRSRSPRHSYELLDWSTGAMRALGLDETAEEVRLRQAACLLGDISWRAHPEYRGDQGLHMLAYGAFIGVDHPGRAYLALGNYYRHLGLGTDEMPPRIREMASPRLIERARALAGAHRVAYLLTGGIAGVLPRTRLEGRGKALTLVLPDDLKELAGDRIERRLSQLARIAGMEPTIAVEKARAA